MKSKPPSQNADRPARGAGGFTLAEVLAALLFMAIVIPAAVEGLRLANLAGVVAERKGQAARVAEQILNESIITTNWIKPSLTGIVSDGPREFRWTLRSETWQDLLRTVSVQVSFAVQGRDYDVRLSTLVDGSPPP